MLFWIGLLTVTVYLQGFVPTKATFQSKVLVLLLTYLYMYITKNISHSSPIDVEVTIITYMYHYSYTCNYVGPSH